ncbi:hypothetical protein I4I84_07600 [Pseudonocardia sp. KRD-182]|uniref:hypothetical protein n=1 Tax=Pseudonocardia oceani TaxID=2792013 RepID=UPI001C4A6513|nr:hypothetical protein [Pseudonocardia oceani]MBW0108588.1 hypothetical protein [Pseudonocardia oceani]
MTLRDRLSQLSLRLPTGLYILDSGLSKRGADEVTAKSLHGLAAGSYPPLTRVEPAAFAKALSAGEIALGAALLAPFVPARVAGAGLTAFGAGLIVLYIGTPRLRRPGSPFPSPDGIALAEDGWPVGTGLALLSGDRRAAAGTDR